jgi:RNA polymerase sigma-70 factor (ECF subfamily)
MSLSKKQVEKLFCEHKALVVRAVAAHRPNIPGITAEDVQQEVCIRLWNTLKNDRQIDNPPSYIYRMTANVIVDLARKNQRHSNETKLPHEGDEDCYRAELESSTASPERQVFNEEKIQQIMAVIDTLNENRRTAIKLRLQGFSIKEMSEITGWSFYKAENLSKRAFTALKQRLKELDIEYDN